MKIKDRQFLDTEQQRALEKDTREGRTLTRKTESD
jgi:hypothetical protein